jgi:hypothetical protein
MQTVEVEIHGRSGVTKANVMFDTGSDRSYVSTEIVKKIDPEFVKSEVVSYRTFGGSKPKSEDLRNLYSMELRGLETGKGLVIATEIPTVCTDLCRRKLPDPVLRSLGRVKLANGYTKDKQIKVDMLIGLDQYWKLVQPDIIPVTDELVAQRTVFG